MTSLPTVSTSEIYSSPDFLKPTSETGYVNSISFLSKNGFLLEPKAQDPNTIHLQNARKNFSEQTGDNAILEYNEILDNRAGYGIFDSESYMVYNMTLSSEYDNSDTLTLCEDFESDRKSSISSVATLEDSSLNKSTSLLCDPKGTCWSSQLHSNQIGSTYLNLEYSSFRIPSKYRAVSNCFRVYSLERRMIKNRKIVSPLKNRFIKLNPMYCV
ncbi:hypothetical protein BB559_004330 [Furculomyces boomerangus]|uniref:Uncharacterized protein n=2 Tax=Harpellales TaxID=61421 RepID=A0A2T9YFJ6_9FUNG|nr:hypothetical protein BB559_004330 [Furculomyces boomerangus]PVZ99561.1 hypothetical protein BB558_004483 [Smittium angustum]